MVRNLGEGVTVSVLINEVDDVPEDDSAEPSDASDN
jgi:hypothetical protein